MLDQTTSDSVHDHISIHHSMIMWIWRMLPQNTSDQTGHSKLKVLFLAIEADWSKGSRLKFELFYRAGTMSYYDINIGSQ